MRATQHWSASAAARGGGEVGVKQVVSLSGGKDSTAMLLMMLERGERVDDVVWFDTGWEFPEMREHIRKLEAYAGVRVTIIYPRRPFVESMIYKPVMHKSGGNPLYGLGMAIKAP